MSPHDPCRGILDWQGLRTVARVRLPLSSSIVVPSVYERRKTERFQGEPAFTRGAQAVKGRQRRTG